MLCDPAARDKVKAAGGNPDQLVDLYVDAINEAVKAQPADMTVGVHVCRGNYKGMYLSEGGYDSVAERFFGRTKVNHFLLEFDTPRAGGFEPLRFVPKDKGVVLGLVSSKTPLLENAGPAQAPRRGSGEVHRSRAPRDQPAVRLRQHDGRQSGHRGRRARQAPFMRPGRTSHLGIVHKRR